MFGLSTRAQGAIIAGVLLLAAAGGALWLFARDVIQPEPEPTPEPQITVSAGDLQSLPERPANELQAAAEELEGFLADLYERAFLPPLPAPTPGPEDPESPAPTPIPRPPVRDLFTATAASSLAEQPGAFRTTDEGVVQQGGVEFGGVVTLDGDQAVSAWVDVTFRARGRLREGDATPDPDDAAAGVRMRLEQSGRLFLVRTDAGWRVSGFDVRIEVERHVPGATPVPDGENAA